MSNALPPTTPPSSSNGTTTPPPKTPIHAQAGSVPVFWLAVGTAIALGMVVGAFIFSSPSAGGASAAPKREAPQYLDRNQWYGYEGAGKNTVPVARAISTMPPSSASGDEAHMQMDRRLATMSGSNGGESEGSIMSSQPTPAWAAATPVAPARVAVVYDARDNDRPLLVTETSNRVSVPPISGPLPNTSNRNAVAYTDGSREMVMPDVESTPGPVTIPAGSRILAVLDQDVDSDLEGPVRAHVAADVCDPRTGAVAIPRGAWLLGRQGGDTINGSRHLGITWTRLTYPDLSSRLLIGTDTLDNEGHSGIAGRPNVSGWQTFRDTFTSSLAAAAGQVATQAASHVGGGNSTVIIDPSSAVNVSQSTTTQQRQSWTVGRNTQFFLYLERDFDREAAYRGESCGG